MSNLVRVIEDIIETRLGELHTCMPGKVVKVDVAAAKCDVQPLLKRTYSDGEIVTMPVITNVPISFYRAGKAFISLPVHVGDYVELRFAERSLDVWLEKGGEVDPADFRKFDLSDAIAYPGLYPNSDPPAGADASSIIIKNDQATIKINADGTIELCGNSDAVALASLVMAELNKLRQFATTHTHPVATTGTAAAQSGTAAPSVTVLQPSAEVKSEKVKAI